MLFAGYEKDWLKIVNAFEYYRVRDRNDTMLGCWRIKNIIKFVSIFCCDAKVL